MIRIIFKGLSPNDTITYENKIYGNGAVIDMEDECAKPYLDVGIAYRVIDEYEAKRFQQLELKNAELRKELETRKEA